VREEVARINAEEEKKQSMGMPEFDFGGAL
jgi:hypothetical protein